ncbi:ankyrin repeat domain-containing protein [Geobacter hydrogenophilus]|uniref:Ankyrin n=1 Tax=Geobacter hydrogenophilus TaxID=40983 RepID=A0A9W6G172_9BACT|nr:ankyrin repeat domain-containing protein [Geobacter hydrogenophilus]MBT0894111.1 ankyrin repeat domain-containing protein [Geobacter hydrogenophilus]GLI38606.1 hypothetical protein GHYDROH2_21070 [Geobacter hydrogenophilus]
MLIRLLLLVTVASSLTLPHVALAYDYDQEGTNKLMMQLIADVGGHDAVAKNSGKTLRCSHGGTRKITIARGKEKTSYRGEYLNCNQNGSIRDGIFEIELQGDEVLKSTARRSKNGELFDAAMEGDTARVGKLIKAKADVNYSESIENSQGGTIEQWTPLMSAVARESRESVGMLVKAGAWVNYMNSLAVSPLWIAANSGQTDTVKFLAKHGAYLNNSNHEDVTPLMAAAMNGHLDVVRFLVGAKAKMNAVHKDGDTALMFAVARNHTDIARFLIDAGADVAIRNRFGVTALIIAAAEGNEEIVRRLLEKKADTSARTTDGKTALDVARARGFTAIAALLEKGI